MYRYRGKGKENINRKINRNSWKRISWWNDIADRKHPCQIE